MNRSVTVWATVAGVLAVFTLMWWSAAQEAIDLDNVAIANDEAGGKLTVLYPANWFAEAAADGTIRVGSSAARVADGDFSRLGDDEALGVIDFVTTAALPGYELEAGASAVDVLDAVTAPMDAETSYYDLGRVRRVAFDGDEVVIVEGQFFIEADPETPIGILFVMVDSYNGYPFGVFYGAEETLDDQREAIFSLISAVEYTDPIGVEITPEVAVTGSATPTPLTTSTPSPPTATLSPPPTITRTRSFPTPTLNGPTPLPPPTRAGPEDGKGTSGGLTQVVESDDGYGGTLRLRIPAAWFSESGPTFANREAALNASQLNPGDIGGAALYFTPEDFSVFTLWEADDDLTAALESFIDVLTFSFADAAFDPVQARTIAGAPAAYVYGLVEDSMTGELELALFLLTVEEGYVLVVFTGADSLRQNEPLLLAIAETVEHQP
jgi:hypothetical protein